ncbi:MAG: metallophosphoesterase [Firmicutes bacterium]|nr:metallophosphoesterase [Bacillota bacterium]
MDGRIFITGDKHGAMAPFFGLAEKQELLPSDIMLITGDAGYVFYDDYRLKLDTLEQLFPGQIAFIDGNHENFHILNNMEESTWCGGRVHQVSQRIIHLMRGEIYDIYGNTVFTFGGARTTDHFDREKGEGWWPDEEEPTEDEMKRAEDVLFSRKDDIDYVISHEAPMYVRNFTTRKKHVPDDYRLPGLLDRWYREMKGAEGFKRWYFGHMHVDMKIEEDLMGLHNEILILGTDERIRW